MKILLVYGYSQKNAGDLAITLGALDILLSKNHEVTVLSRYNKSSQEFFNSKRALNERYGDKVEVLECPFTLNRESGLLRALRDHIDGALYITGLKRSAMLERRIREADLVVFNGGNLLRCSGLADFLRLKALFYPLKRAKKNGKEYIIFPQSTAEINSLGEPSIVEVIKEAKAVYIRENLSYEKLLKEYQFNNLKRSLDCAFFIDHTSRWKHVLAGEKKIIGFTLRAQTVGDLNELSDEEQRKVISEMLPVIEAYKDVCEFRLIIQTKKDIKITKSLYKEVHEKTGLELEIIEEYEPLNLVSIFAEIDLLIGMRLHSIILALSCGTPCYGLFYSQWGLKNEGLMKEFDLPFNILDSKDNKIDLGAVQSLLDNGQEISENILKVVEDGKERLKELI